MDFQIGVLGPSDGVVKDISFLKDQGSWRTSLALTLVSILDSIDPGYAHDRGAIWQTHAIRVLTVCLVLPENM